MQTIWINSPVTHFIKTADPDPAPARERFFIDQAMFWSNIRGLPTWPTTGLDPAPAPRTLLIEHAHGLEQ